MQRTLYTCLSVLWFSTNISRSPFDPHYHHAGSSWVPHTRVRQPSPSISPSLHIFLGIGIQQQPHSLVHQQIWTSKKDSGSSVCPKEGGKRPCILPPCAFPGYDMQDLLSNLYTDQLEAAASIQSSAHLSKCDCSSHGICDGMRFQNTMPQNNIVSWCIMIPSPSQPNLSSNRTSPLLFLTHFNNLRGLSETHLVGELFEICISGCLLLAAILEKRHTTSTKTDVEIPLQAKQKQSIYKACNDAFSSSLDGLPQLLCTGDGCLAEPTLWF